MFNFSGQGNLGVCSDFLDSADSKVDIPISGETSVWFAAPVARRFAVELSKREGTRKSTRGERTTSCTRASFLQDWRPSLYQQVPDVAGRVAAASTSAVGIQANIYTACLPAKGAVANRGMAAVARLAVTLVVAAIHAPVASVWAAKRARRITTAA